MLKSKPEFKRAPEVESYYDVNDVWGSSTDRQYFKNLKEMLEAQQTRVANVKFQEDLRRSKNAMNYKAELDRIRGELSSKNNPFDAQAISQLEARKKELNKLIKQTADDVKGYSTEED